MRRTLYIVGFGVFGLFLFFLGIAVGQHQQPLQTLGAKSIKPSISLTPLPSATTASLVKVTKVIDGDTIDVSLSGKKETVRLIGIDTPEVVDPRKPVQCFGMEASVRAKEMLTGQMVRLEADPTQGERDKYHRLLRYVFLQDGTNFNKFMIAEGYAHEYTYNIPYKYQKEFKQAEKRARDQQKGLWAPDACNTTSSSVTTAPTISLTSDAALSTTPMQSGAYTCDCSKSCSQIQTCEEATFQLKNCGCSARDADGDGVPCESLCR